jgi:hypothetical protein
MDYTKLTTARLIKIRKDILLQQAALEELDTRIINELSKREGKKYAEKVKKNLFPNL